jgi:hypothetical protein
MRFLMTYQATDRTPAGPEKAAAIAKFAEDMTRAGILLDTGGMMPLSQGAAVRMANGKFTTLDGPFPETKELIVGYAIVQTRTRDEAVEISRRFMAIAGDGEGEIRQLVGPQDEPPH